MLKKKYLLWMLLCFLGLGILFGTKKYQSYQKNLELQKNKQELRLKKKQLRKKQARRQLIYENLWKKENEKIKFPILMYHSIYDDPNNRLCVSPNEFAHQMQWLKENGYYTLSTAEAYRVLLKNEKPAKKIVWVTLDDGYENNYTSAYPALKENKVHATINIITQMVEQNDPDKLTLKQIKEMKKSGYVDFESHTVSHHELNLQNEQQQQFELNESKQWLDRKLNQDTTMICYPAGKYNEVTLLEAKKAGYRFAITTKEGLANDNDGMYTLNRVRVTPHMTDTSFKEVLEKD